MKFHLKSVYTNQEQITEVLQFQVPVLLFKIISVFYLCDVLAWFYTWFYGFLFMLKF